MLSFRIFARCLMALILSLSFAHCGNYGNYLTQNNSNLNYLILQPDEWGLSYHVKKKVMGVCISFISPDGNSEFGEPTDSDIDTSLDDPEVQAEWVSWAEQSLKIWLTPLREISSTELAKTFVSRLDQGCDDTYADFSVSSRLTHNEGATGVGERPHVVIGERDSTPFRTTLHEFGHAFGMDDTYRNACGQTGSPHPNAVMCSLSYDSLQSDDIAGIRDIYHKIFIKQ